MKYVTIFIVNFGVFIINSLNPYQFKSSDSTFKQGRIGINVGGQYAPIEITRNFLTIPEKIILLNKNYSSGNISKETIDKVEKYLEENQLWDVAVSVNEYDPKFLLERTLNNPNISNLSKYTMGILSVLVMTMLCPKLTGRVGDCYNPWANSIHLFSDDLSIALHECGHAKDFSQRENPGLYSSLSMIPFIGPFQTLYKEYQANKNVYHYLHSEKKDSDALKQACITLTPAYTAYISGALAYFAKRGGIKKFQGVKPFIALMTAGHITGHLIARTIECKSK